VGDDVVPTSLNEGRGEVLVLVLIVAFHMRRRQWMDGAVRCSGRSEEPKCESVRNAPPCEMRKRAKCRPMPNAERARNGISRGALVVPRTSRTAGK